MFGQTRKQLRRALASQLAINRNVLTMYDDVKTHAKELEAELETYKSVNDSLKEHINRLEAVQEVHDVSESDELIQLRQENNRLAEELRLINEKSEARAQSWGEKEQDMHRDYDTH